MPESAFDLRDYLLNGKPSGATLLAETFPRDQVASDIAAALVTQVMTSVALPLVTGDIVTNLGFLSGATAAGVPTNWWFALYDPSLNLLAQTADQLTAAWAADTLKTLALTTPQRAAVDGVYYAAIMVKATTVPSLVGKLLARTGLSAAVQTGQKQIAQTSGAALTTTAPATIATPANTLNVPYAIAS